MSSSQHLLLFLYVRSLTPAQEVGIRDLQNIDDAHCSADGLNGETRRP